MSDTARQGFTDKASAALKPDSEKSTTEHIGDKFKGKADSAASTAEPEVCFNVIAYNLILMLIVSVEREVIRSTGHRRFIWKPE